MLKTGTVTIGDKQWTVGIATTPEDLAQGLAGVESMPADTGMLFDLGTEQIISITAEGMLFPIDIIFIDDDLKVTEVAFGLQPGDWGTSSLPALYFLEVNAGEAVGIEEDDVVVIDVGLEGAPPWEVPAIGIGIDISAMMGLVVVMMMVIMMMKMMTGVIGPTKPELPPGYVPVKHSIHGPERQRLVDQYGSWSVGRAESVCPEDDVACVERESARLLQAHRRGFGA